MELLIGLLVLILIVVGGFLLIQRSRSTPSFQRAEQVTRTRSASIQEPERREPSVANLQPGDAIAFGDGDNGLVVSVIECREEVGPRQVSWRWSFLDDGKMLASARDGNILFDPAEIIYQGSEPFQRLVAPTEQGGALKLFEQRVRDGAIASNPVTFEHDGQNFHLRSTGVFTAVISGRPLGMVWDDLSPRAQDNVYFEGEAQSGDQLLGIWTSHSALLIGRRLGVTDVDAIYPGSEEQT